MRSGGGGVKWKATPLQPHAKEGEGALKKRGVERRGKYTAPPPTPTPGPGPGPAAAVAAAAAAAAAAK